MSQGSSRRLSNKDVRAIFESVHDGTPPPSHLPFQVVPVGRRGLKLSPPPYEFPDGLYLLIKHPNKKKNPEWDTPNVPPHLKDQMLDANAIPSDGCPWSLSGPQFPQPTAIQQRYCYPKGRKEYSDQKGGALWTMHDGDHNEDFRYRLLHVYYSAKRAVNRGNEVPSSELPETPARKRLKDDGGTPPRNIQAAASPVTLSSHAPTNAMPADMKATDASPVRIFSSSPQATAVTSATTPIARSNFVTPMAHDTFEGQDPTSIQVSTIKSQNIMRAHNRLPPVPPSPFSQASSCDTNHHGQQVVSAFNVPVSSPITSSRCQVATAPRHPFQENMQKDETDQSASLSWGSFSFDQNRSLSFDTDPMFNSDKEWTDAFMESFQKSDDDPAILLARRLDAIHEDVKELIRLAQEPSEKERLVSILSKWAKQVSQSPLGDMRIRGELK